MALSAEKDSFAFSDFLTWETDERMEIIHGEVFMMAAPGTSHQLISGEIFRQLANFLDGKNCRAIAAPFAVRLFDGGTDGAFVSGGRRKPCADFFPMPGSLRGAVRGDDRERPSIRMAGIQLWRNRDDARVGCGCICDLSWPALPG